MTKIIIDSYAWIEYLLSTDKGLKVKNIIENGNNKICTHILSLAEIVSRLSRSGVNYSESIEGILTNSEILHIDENASIRAGNIHTEIRKEIKDFGLVDAFILLAAKDNNMRILTGDPHFKNIKVAIII